MWSFQSKPVWLHNKSSKSQSQFMPRCNAVHLHHNNSPQTAITDDEGGRTSINLTWKKLVGLSNTENDRKDKKGSTVHCAELWSWRSKAHILLCNKMYLCDFVQPVETSPNNFNKMKTSRPGQVVTCHLTTHQHANIHKEPDAVHCPTWQSLIGTRRRWRLWRITSVSLRYSFSQHW